MPLHVKYLVHNPQSLKHVCASRIIKSISCIGQSVERNLIKKLVAGDLDDLRNPNMPISLEDMCPMEKKIVLELRCWKWSLLEMYILLTDDIVEFHMGDVDWSPDASLKQLAAVSDKDLGNKQHQDWFLLLLIAKCPKLKRLSMHPHDFSHRALEMFCEALPHITELNLSHGQDVDRNDCMLRGIAAHMHHLKSLYMTYCEVEPEAIEYLLPTEDNTLGGCPKLVDLNLWGIRNVNVKLLKKIILALPKLRSLRHNLLVQALEDLTEEEMDADTARCINSLNVFHFCYASIHSYSHMRYDILVKSPAFERFKTSITTVDIDVRINVEGQNECALITDVLMSMSNLRSITLRGKPEAHNVLSLLESVGDHVVDLCLDNLSGNFSIYDVMRTCTNLVEFTLSMSTQNNANNPPHDQVKQPSKIPVLKCLYKIHLQDLNKQVCSVDMLTALLQSPNLNQITLLDVDALSDDVMWNVLSTAGCAALTRVTRFEVKSSFITAAQFVHWMTKENCSLQNMELWNYGKIDCKTLGDAAEKCRRALGIKMVEVS